MRTGVGMGTTNGAMTGVLTGATTGMGTGTGAVTGGTVTTLTTGEGWTSSERAAVVCSIGSTSAVIGAATARLLTRVRAEAPATQREEQRVEGETTSRRTRSGSEPPSADRAGLGASEGSTRSSSRAVSARA